MKLNVQKKDELIKKDYSKEIHNKETESRDEEQHNDVYIYEDNKKKIDHRLNKQKEKVNCGNQCICYWILKIKNNNSIKPN